MWRASSKGAKPSNGNAIIRSLPVRFRHGRGNSLGVGHLRRGSFSGGACGFANIRLDASLKACIINNQ
jgi:hypothetical protein